MERLSHFDRLGKFKANIETLLKTKTELTLFYYQGSINYFFIFESLENYS